MGGPTDLVIQLAAGVGGIGANLRTPLGIYRVWDHFGFLATTSLEEVLRQTTRRFETRGTLIPPHSERR